MGLIIWLKRLQVVPLDEEFGIIEWVNETASLKELILNSRELQQKYYKLCDDWDKLIKSLYHPHKHGVALSDPYNVFAQVCSRSEAEKRFNDFQKTLPSKLLRYTAFIHKEPCKVYSNNSSFGGTLGIICWKGAILWRISL